MALESSSVARALAALAVALTGAVGCAGGPPLVSKLVDGHIVVTRYVPPDAYEHFARALLFEEDQRWGESARELEQALRYDDQGAEVRAELAEVYTHIGRLDDAAEQIQRSLATAPTVEGYLAGAHLAEARRDDAGAREQFRTAAAQALGEGDAEAIERTHLALASADLAALDLAAAHATVVRLRDAVPDDGRARVELAAMEWAEGRLADAERELLEALAIEADHLDARLMLAAVRVAAGRVSEAKATFREALDRSEDAIDVAEMYIRWLAARGDKAEAAAEAERLAPATVDDATVDAIVRLERAAGRPARARDAAEAALRKGVAAGRIALLVGGALADMKDFSGAAARLLKVGRREPEFIESRLRAAEVLRRQGGVVALGQADRALDEATAALGAPDVPVAPANGKAAAGGGTASAETPPHDWAPDLIVARALLEEKRGVPENALRGLDLALQKDAGNARFLLVRAAIDERRGGWQTALAKAETILREDPRHIEALNFCGFIAADHGSDVPKAIARLQVAMVLNPGAGGIVDSLGWARLHAGDLGAATELLTWADRLEPGDAEILAHLGELYARSKQIERARITYRQALEHDPEERVARDIEKHLRALDPMKTGTP